MGKKERKHTWMQVFGILLLLPLLMIPAAAEVSTEFQPVLETELVQEEISFDRQLDFLPMDQAGNNVDLRDGNYERWIDRVVLSEQIMQLYASLEEACDNDGIDDYLIDDSYFALNGNMPFQTLQAGKWMSADVVYSDQTHSKFTGITVAQAVADTDEARQRLKNQLHQEFLAAQAAFRRDHPEVFWLKTLKLTTVNYWDPALQQRSSVLIMLLWKEDRSANGALKDQFDLRRKEFQPGGETVRSAIEKRDGFTEVILKDCPDGTDVEKVRYLNRWLTEHNEYNTELEGFYEANPGISYSDYKPYVYECVTALHGTTGVNGPVCMSYSGAMKVLCDRLGIPCVIADGLGTPEGLLKGGNHAWNLIKIGENWYCTDVTWNDPVTSSKPEDPVNAPGKSGAEGENYLLIGSGTKNRNVPFSSSHETENAVLVGGLAFLNQPEASETSCMDLHQFDRVDSLHEPTCTEAGLETRFCSHCHAAETAVLPALGHVDALWQQDESKHWKHCSRCDSDYAVGDHEWTLQEEDGNEVTYRCFCGRSRTEKIVTALQFEQNEYALYLNGEAACRLTVLDQAGRPVKGLNWSVDHPAVVSLENGAVSARSAGIAKVTASLPDGLSAETYVVVTSAPAPARITGFATDGETVSELPAGACRISFRLEGDAGDASAWAAVYEADGRFCGVVSMVEAEGQWTAALAHWEQNGCLRIFVIDRESGVPTTADFRIGYQMKF